jgi:DNA-directed RNA polymerase subunit RPC12/RpoP
VTEPVQLDLDPKTPPVWEADRYQREPMCSWCGARSVEEWHRLTALEGLHCPHCHFAPSKERAA